MSIGDRVKECRVKLGYSAEQVAAELGISPATEYRYENGDISKMPAKLIAPLATFLSTTPAYLMGWEDESISDPTRGLNDEEKRLVTAYRAAEPVIRKAALKMLEDNPASVPPPEAKKDTASGQTA